MRRIRIRRLQVQRAKVELEKVELENTSRSNSKEVVHGRKGKRDKLEWSLSNT
jgi:hypothetical protein